MIPLAIAAAGLVIGLFSIQVLKTVDLPRYRPIVFKIFVAMTVWSAGAAAYGLSQRAWALLAVGAIGTILSAERSRYWHAMRHQFDLPPHLTSKAPKVEIEGPSAQAAKRKASRLGDAKEGSGA